MLEIILHFHEREIKTKPTVTIKAEKIRKWNGLSLEWILRLIFRCCNWENQFRNCILEYTMTCENVCKHSLQENGFFLLNELSGASYDCFDNTMTWGIDYKIMVSLHYEILSGSLGVVIEKIIFWIECNSIKNWNLIQLFLSVYTVKKKSIFMRILFQNLRNQK